MIIYFENEGFDLILQQILLKIFSQLNNDRTISAAYHLLRGKRSGQTIQDVGIFKLHEFFCLLPKLSRKIFDIEVARMIEEGFLIVNDDNGHYSMTAKGLEKGIEDVPCIFYGWNFRGNEHIFFGRLSLVIQALSYQSSNTKQFIPIQRDEQIQHFARAFLLQNKYQAGHLQQELFREITESIEKLPITILQKELLINRLTGNNMPGFTWQQLAFDANMSEMDVQLLYISALHNWLLEIPNNYTYLGRIAENIQVDIVLTGSAYQTAEFFKQGHSITEIASLRRLKQSTIEDHIVEYAMSEPKFPFENFVSLVDQKRVFEVIEKNSTRRLKVLHEKLPHLTYFQLRLVMAKGRV